MDLSQYDRELLSLLQREVPLTDHPYAALAGRLDSQEQLVLERVRQLRSGPEPVIREIAGIFEATALGYHAALVGCAVPQERLDEAGRTVARHPGVSHCYAREGLWNLWYTLTLGPDATLSMDQTAQRLAQQSAASRWMVLPTLKRYKIGVHIDARGQMASEGTSRPPPAYEMLQRDQILAVQALQSDLPAEPEPFAILAQRVGLPPARLVAIGSAMLARGVLRRYAAVLHHRRAGLRANVMVVWRAGEHQVDAAGQAAAALPEVSHCYRRPTGPDWPYNLYTMIHGRSDEDCALVIDEIRAVTGLDDYVALWTRQEYKKARVRFFTGETAVWESAE